MDLSREKMSYFSIVPNLLYLQSLQTLSADEVSRLAGFTIPGTYVYYGKSAPEFKDPMVEGSSLHSVLKSCGYFIRDFFQEDGLRKVDTRPTLAKWAFDITASLYDKVVLIPGDLATHGEEWQPIGWSQFLYVLPGEKLTKQLGDRKLSGIITPFMQHRSGEKQYIPFS